MPPKRNQNRSKSHNKNSKNRGKEAPVENAMAHCILPKDMIVSILSRLPVKSLVRFKCVCKPWYKLVSNPNFVKIHSQKFPHSPKTVSFQSHALEIPILGIGPPNKLILAETFLDSCNGLVCLARPLFTKDIILWNPATSFWKLLPHSRIDFGAAASVSLGFGCNAEGDDFKVVRIFCAKGRKMKVGVEVYSSKSDCWRIVDVGFRFTVLEAKNHVIVDGNPYWIASLYDRNTFAEGYDNQVLLGFDATSMEFKFVVPLPNFQKLGSMMPFANWEGQVAVISCIMNKYDDECLEWIEVWVYDHGEKRWRRDARFGPLEVEAIMCLDISKAGKIVGGSPDGTLFTYDPKENCVRLSKLNRPEGYSFQIFAYDESLVHLKGMTNVAVRREDHKDKFNDVDGFFVASLHRGSGAITCYFALES